MKEESEKKNVPMNILEQVVLKGNLNGLTDEEIIQYYYLKCESIGLDPKSQPFDIIEKGKDEKKVKKLFINAGGAAQLTAIHQISTKITDKEVKNGYFWITVTAKTPDGRETDDLSLIQVTLPDLKTNLGGEEYTNAIKKATTQAKRRAIIAHVGVTGLADDQDVTDVNYSEVEKPEMISITEPPIKIIEPAGVIKDLPEATTQFLKPFWDGVKMEFENATNKDELVSIKDKYKQNAELNQDTRNSETLKKLYVENIARFK
jgi:hypothetical protein